MSDVYIYGALILYKAKQPINVQNLLGVVAAAGYTPDVARARLLVDALAGVDIGETIQNAGMPQATLQPPQAVSTPTKNEQPAKPEDDGDEVSQGLKDLFG